MKADVLLKQARRTLVAANSRFGWQGDEADQAWDILATVLGRQPLPNEDVPPALVRRFRRLVERRTTGEPLAYILGWVDFLDFRMTVRPGAFVPRLTSEFLARQAIRRLRGRRRPIHVDLATGIGPVAIAAARAVRNAEVWGVDISKEAIRQARANALRLKASNARFTVGDLYAPLPRRLRGQVDVVTVHPPYVPRGELGELPIEIRKYEPRHTLTDRSPDGLGLVRRVIYEGREWLRRGGWVLIEIVPSEWQRIRSILRDAGYTDVRSTHGELKLTRVICGRLA